MTTWNLVLLVAIIVVGILYMMKRKARLRKDD